MKAPAAERVRPVHLAVRKRRTGWRWVRVGTGDSPAGQTETWLGCHTREFGT